MRQSIFASRLRLNPERQPNEVGRAKWTNCSAALVGNRRAGANRTDAEARGQMARLDWRDAGALDSAASEIYWLEKPPSP